MEQQEIEKRICAMADALGFSVSENIEKIARVKSRMTEPRRCPCCPTDPDMYCGSVKCEQATIKNGHCCCNLFLYK